MPIGAIAAILPSVAEAGLVEKVEAHWQIEPSTDAQLEVTLNPGDMVTRSLMSPDGSVELTADAVRSDDSFLIARRGEQLYARPARGTTAYCAQSSRKVLSANAIGAPNSAATDPCFIDRDNDGFFDESFRIDTWNAKVVGMAFVSKKNVKISPVPYRKIPADEFHDKPSIGIKYVGTSPLTHREKFTLVFGGKVPATEVCCGVVATGDTYPRSVQLMGAKLSILKNEAGRISVRIDAPLAQGPFAVRGNI